MLAICGSARAEQVVISKIMYHPPTGFPEYFELFNNTATPLDIANWQVTQAVKFPFPDFSTNEPSLSFLKPFERIVLSEAPPSVAREAYRIPDTVRIFGPWQGKLKNGEDRITVKDQNGALVCTVKYADRGHWPRSADGAGHALALKNPNHSVDNWRNWTASDLPGGSPGQKPMPQFETPIPDPQLGINQGIALLNYTDKWRYDDNGRDLGTAWREPNFDDSSWTNGVGLLGFTKDKAPPIPPLKTSLKKNRQITYYFRKQFVVDRDLSKLQVAIDQWIDDGAVYYLNGKELARVRMPVGLIDHKTGASLNVREPAEELNAFSVNPHLFKPGTNLLAVELHQDRTNSSDLAFAVRLRAYTASQSPVLLNELALIPNNGGFLELFNAGSKPLNLKNYFITDTPLNLRKSQIKTELIIAPGGLAALGFPELGLAPTNPLSIYLLEPDGVTLVDAAGVTFTSDTRPVGRKPAGAKAWFRFPEATRGQPNAAQETSPPIKLNEIHFTKGSVDWIELFNPLNNEASLGGLFLSTHRDLKPKITLSGNIPARGFTSIPVSLPLPIEEVNLYLVDSRKAVLDCHTFVAPEEGESLQAYPDGTAEWYLAAGATRDKPNQPRRNTDVVINEIMYDAPKSAKTCEYVELFNRGRATVDLSDWELTDGIRFKFPRGTQIPAQGFLVVSSDIARMKTVYGNVLAIGNFSGKLHNFGDIVRLVDQSGNLVNSVDFKSGGDWPALANGAGSSLELANPWMDNSLSSAWRDSDESAKSKMRQYSCTGTYEELHVKGGPTDYKELHLHLVGEGHVALDGIALQKRDNATNLIVNGTRLSNDGFSAKGWLCQGTHWASFITNGQLHLVSDGRGDNRPNRAEIDVTGLKKGEACELKFNARWINGNPRLIAQTWDHSIAGSFLLEVPANLGTPGKENSRYLPDPAPQVDSLAHSPAIPHSTNIVTITAAVLSSSPLQSVQLFHRLDNDKADGVWTNLVMRDDGQNGDIRANDGTYTTQLGGYKGQGQIIQFYAQANAENGSTSVLPRSGAAAPAMFVIDNRRAPRDLRTVRFIVSAADLNAMADGNTARHGFKYPRHSNRYFNATFISNEEEIYYNCQARNSGSPWTRGGGLDRPKFKTPADRRFRSHDHFYFDNDAAGGNFHNRVTRYWLYLMGHAAAENEIVRVVLNNSGFDLREDTEPVHNDLLNRNFHNGSKGQLYRIDDEWWFTDNWDRDQRDADWSYKNSDNPGRYRSEWMKRTNEEEDDFSDLIAFFKVVSADKYSQTEIEKYLDTDAILRYSVVRAYISDWDTFTMGRGKNAFFYQRADDGKFQFLQWDSDLSFGDPNSGFTGGRISSWVEKPFNRRLHDYYLAEFARKCTSDSLRFRQWLQEEENASAAYSINTNFYLSWCTNREPAVQRQLGELYRRPFAITPPKAGLTLTNETITLTGTAPLAVRTIRLDQQPAAVVTWKDPATWRLTNIHLNPGVNPFLVKAIDHSGKSIHEAKISITRSNAVLTTKPAS